MEKEKKASPPKKDNSEEFLAKIGEMLSPITKELFEMEKRIKAGEEKLAEMDKPAKIEINGVFSPVCIPPDSTASDPYYIPCPQRYIEIKNEILSEDFGISLSMAEGGFAVSIVVPEKFSNLNKQEYEYRKSDVRTKVISNAKGEIGIREWLEKVRENLRETFKKEKN